MALEGSLRDFGLADILQLIFFQRKTGVLNLEGKLDKIRLLFIDGHIVGAESKRRMEANRLGKVLTKKGLLKEEELQAMLEEQKKSNLKLGSFLVRKGIIKKEDVEETLTGQIKETIIQIFNWKEGTYEFTPQSIPPDKDIPISIDTQHLLMESLRIVDEWTLIEGKITLDTFFRKKTDDVSELGEEERDILFLVDGENDVSTIIDISGKDDFTVSKTLISLLEKDIIERKEAVPVSTDFYPAQARKTFIYNQNLPAFAIAVAVILSLLSVFFESHHVFQKFRASETVDDLRFRIAAHKFEHGSYPAELHTVDHGSDPWGNPYIYHRSENSFLVLSAGPDGKEGTADDVY
jgi:predicted transcriptional regulator